MQERAWQEEGGEASTMLMLLLLTLPRGRGAAAVATNLVFGCLNIDIIVYDDRRIVRTHICEHTESNCTFSVTRSRVQYRVVQSYGTLLNVNNSS